MPPLGIEAWDDPECLEYCQQVELVLALESLQADPVYQRFRYHYFVSRSKGRGRNGRPNWVEVELINDRWEPLQPRWHSWDKFPFDVKATEVFPNSAEAESRLMSEIPRKASR